MTDVRESMKNAVTVGGYKCAAFVSRVIPAAVGQRLVRVFAPVIALISRKRRAMVERHLSRVDPTLQGKRLRSTSAKAFDSYLRYYVESFRLPSRNAQHVDQHIHVDGFDLIPPILEKGNGVILALPHLGGWEWAGRWMTDRGYKMTVVVEPLQPPALFEWFVGLRENLGMKVIPLGPDAAAEVLKSLRNNELVCLLCDRDIQGGGIEVDFFGEKTTLPAGPAMLAMRAGSEVLPTAVYFTDDIDGHTAIVRPPISLERQGSLREDVSRATQELARELEFLISRSPEQWHLFQPNWPSDPGFQK
jgi:phosphatidylinositol dimannoside acyltransferase